MLSRCGPDYLRKVFHVTINNDVIAFETTEKVIEKDYIKYFLTSKNYANLNSITVQTDYPFGDDSHSIQKVQFQINNQSKSYTLRREKKKIIAYFE